MYNDLVSVVVPIYNVEKYLDRCISSIVNQSYWNLEIILVDDGSPDRCPQICEEWAKRDERIKVIHKTNAGLGMARNTGIEHASGDYICFFDSDDYIAPRTIEKAHTLAKEKDAQIVIFGMQTVDKNGNVVNTMIPQSPKSVYRREEVRNVFLPDLIDNQHDKAMIRNLCFSAWSCLYSMKLVRQYQWEFVSERTLISEDSYSLIWLYQYVDTVAILPEACYFYCENASSLTHTYREDRYGRIVQFYRECMAMVKKVGYNRQVETSVSGLHISFTIAAMKQIAAADVNIAKKKTLLRQILEDDDLQQSLVDISDRTYGKARRVLFWAMRQKSVFLCYILLVAQNMAQR